jgi:hypothetical protein
VQTFVNCFGTSCVCGFGCWLFAPCAQAGKVAATQTNVRARSCTGDGHAVWEGLLKYGSSADWAWKSRKSNE